MKLNNIELFFSLFLGFLNKGKKYIIIKKILLKYLVIYIILFFFYNFITFIYIIIYSNLKEKIK